MYNTWSESWRNSEYNLEAVSAMLVARSLHWVDIIQGGVEGNKA